MPPRRSSPLLPAWLLACLLALAPAWAAALENRLHGHASPYLALHGDDPVAWQEWNAETLARARRENKLLFVSVGYFSCHWCHVMQRESYRDPAIAALLNRHFIPVKVDRELNGALDAALIEFAERFNGVAGWPLNVFVTPEGYPAYAVLYLPPGDFKAQLDRLAAVWSKRGEAFARTAREAGAAAAGPAPEESATTPADLEQAFLRAAWREADTLQGGFGRVSKFPMPSHLTALLELYRRDRDPRLGEFLRLTLDRMAGLGLRDHVHGGFFRYTVDPDWHTPHFEKMLYDNAQLVLVYHRAAALFGRADYRQVARQTLDFMLESLRVPGGGFRTAISALDRRGREGGAYLWTAEALRARLTKAEFDLASRIWALDQPAPFELGYLPMQKREATAAERGRQRAILARLKQAGRMRDAVPDDKVNAGLNGLALSAFSIAGRGVPRFEAAARDLRGYVERELFTGGRLLKTRVGGRVFAEAELEDYVFLAAGLRDYAGAHADAGADVRARDLVRQAWQRFHTGAGWRREERPLLATVRPEPAFPDGALPSASARLIALSSAMLAERRQAGLAPWIAEARAMALASTRAAPFDFPGLLAIQNHRGANLD